MRRICVVLPTYNESDNIRPILDSIFTDGISPRDYSTEVVIVDDKSPDGTAAIARTHAKQKGYDITIVSGEKDGLGAAYKRGFAHVIKHDLADIIIMMDADLSHDAKEIKHMVAQVEDGADLVIGSRYVQGGKIPGDWPMLRIINSRVARFVTRYIGGLGEEVEDPAGGFRAINVEQLKKLNFDQNVNGSGYVFQVGTVNHFIESGMNVGEHPIAFNDRQFGESKIRAKDILEYFAFCLNMKDTSPFKHDLSVFARAMLAMTVFALVTAIGGNNELSPYVARALGVQAGLATAIMVMPEVFAWFKNIKDTSITAKSRVTRALKYTLSLDIALTSVTLATSAIIAAVGLSSVVSFVIAAFVASVTGIGFIRAVNGRVNKRIIAHQLHQKSLS